MKVLYPIKKEYVTKICDRTKAYEYRKHLCKEDVDTVVMYESRNKGLVVGEFEIIDRLCDSPSNLWERTKELSGISKECYDNYFRGHDLAYAYAIGNVTVFLKQKTLAEYGITFPPQNYIYIE